MLNVTMTHDRYGRTTQHATGLPDPVVFMTLIFLHAHREASVLAGELPHESDQFRFLRAAGLGNLKGSVGLILAKSSTMRVTIPIDLSTCPFIPIPRFFRSRHPPPLLICIIVLKFIMKR
jgi:hypothetical protein